MTISTTDLTDWLGTNMTAALSVDQIAGALADANRYCNGKMEELGIGAGSGDAFDAAVFYVARASLLRQLDVMNVKPSNLNMGGTLTIGSDVTQNVDQLMKMADERLQSAAIFSSSHKTDMYIVRLRGGQGMNR